jgi:25S rRNA (uracil2634-N3)-methyltransferase
MAKKGRVARILTTLHRVAGTPISEALKRRQRAAIQRGDAGTHGGEKSQWKKRKERKARREAFEGAATQTGLPHGYHSGQRVLLVGEGNLSFALALTTLFDGEGANVLATSLDRPGVARAAYPDLRDIEQSLEASGAAVRFGVDVEDGDALRKAAKAWWAAGNDPEARAANERGGGGAEPGAPSGAGPGGFFKGFDRVVWNFPDAGVGVVGRLAVQANQDLLDAFFRAAKPLLSKEGEVHVAMRACEHRARWNVAGVAARAGYVHRASLAFAPADFPGYEHFRTLGEAFALETDAFERGTNEGADTQKREEPADDDVAEGAQTLIFQAAEKPEGKARARRGVSSARGEGDEEDARMGDDAR